MSNTSISSTKYKYYPKQGVGFGSRRNAEVTHCDLCAENGFPHESVVVQTLPNNAIRVMNYNNGTDHKHRILEQELLDDPNVWEELWKK